MTMLAQVPPELVARLEAALAQPVYFRQLLDAAEGHSYRDLLAAWSDVRSRRRLQRDERGRFWLPADGGGLPLHSD